MQRRLIIDGDLFARLNVTQCNEKDVFVENFHERIGLTGMIDVMRAVSAATSVYAPTIVYCTNPKCLAVSSPICFCVRDLFAGVFRDLLAADKSLGRKASFAVDRRPFDG